MSLSATLYPIADSYLEYGSPDANYGTSTVLYLRSRVKTNTVSDARSFLKFDLSSLPSGAVITLAKLRLYCYTTIGLLAGVTDVEARRVSDDTWTETGITWNNQPVLGNVEDTKVPAVGWIEWNVTSWVQNEWTGDKIVSLGLKCVVESYNTKSRGSGYYSKEFDGYDSELYIEYTIPLVKKLPVGSIRVGLRVMG